MAKGYFVTGTDTGVGKTLISAALLQRLGQQGVRCAGYKPVASGADQTAEGLRNEDGLSLQAASSVALPYELINPYVLAPAIAPHIAAEQVGMALSVAGLVHGYQQLAKQVDTVVVEGAGGWLVPLNAEETLADLALALQLPVILVVGVRLGCINHALLTAQAIRASGLPLAGWVANRVSTDPMGEENIATIQARLPDVPLLGVVPWLKGYQDAVAYLRLP